MYIVYFLRTYSWLGVSTIRQSTTFDTSRSPQLGSNLALCLTPNLAVLNNKKEEMTKL